MNAPSVCRGRSRTNNKFGGRAVKISARRHTTLLEVESQLRRQRARRDVVGTAKGGKEIVEGDLVGNVNGCQAQAPLVAVLAEQVVVSQTNVKEISGSNARRIVVVIRRSRCRNLDQRRAELGCGA